MARDVLIAGAWNEGAGTPFATRDPAYRETVWEGASANAAQVDEAVRGARAAFPAWADTEISEREARMRAFAAGITERGDALAEAISRAMGKPLWESKTEVAAVIGKIEISIAKRRERAGEHESDTPFGALTLAHRPLGVMAVFGPFNFPAHLPNGHIVPALLAGNTVVFKPSELAPGPGALMAEAWEAAGLPSGVFNLVQGARETGAALLENKGINGVLFTGSAATGLMIHRQFAGRPDVVLALEMGGNNPLIVWPPADAHAASNLIAHSAWATSGQRCSCARRLILPEGVFGDAVLEELADLGGKLSVHGWKEAPEAFMGPLVTEAAAKHAQTFARKLIKRGGKEILPVKREGAFLRPALIDMTGVNKPPDEESFSPVLQVYRVATLEDAFARANATAYGLAGGMICDDAEVWKLAQRRMRAGVFNWNRPTTGASSALPFGGPGLSGDLRPSAAYAADYCAYPVASQTAPAAKAIAATGLPE